MTRTRGFWSAFALLPLIALVAALAGAAPGGAARSSGHPAAPGELIVVFAAGVPKSQRDALLASVGARERHELGAIDGELADLDPTLVTEAIARLERDPRVAYAEPNYLLFADAIPNDPSFGELWGLHNVGQTVNTVTGTADADIDAVEAWDVATGGTSVSVGVIDTGVDFGHPDLAAAQWINPGEDCPGCRADGIDNDGNGFVDDWRGWDFVSNDNNPFDDNGHGTHVAGTIGATGNDARGVVGVNWNVRIAALKFLSAAGSGTTANAIRAIDYATGKGFVVTNNSWGGGGFSQALLDAIRRADTAGSLFVAAAGNDGVNTDSTPHYPSSYDAPNVISVAATTNTDARASFSNFGAKTVDLGAPGANIFSTYPGGMYRYFNGTSMATPHVAGVLALAKSHFAAGSTAIGLKTLLLRSVDANTALATITTTGGRLNANTAVRCSAAPKVWIEAPAPGFSVNVGQAVSLTVLGSSCASAGAAVAATGNGSPIALTARGDGLYSGSYTPAAGGTVTISATSTVAALVDERTVTGNAVAPPPPAAVAAPTNLRAQVSTGRVKLFWTASATAAVTYSVYRSPAVGTVCGTFARIASGITKTNWENRPVARGSYCYRVTAVKGAGESGPSNTLAVTVP